MSRRLRLGRPILACALAALAWSASAARAETLFGVTATDKLVTLDSGAPGAVSDPVAITGLADGETIEGIDVRPATLQLYALGSTGQLYRVDTVTGAATAIGSPLEVFGNDVDIDFDPTVDRLRIGTDFGQNTLVDPDAPQAGGSPAAGGDHSYADGSDPDVTGIAYTANAPASAAYPAAPATQLYGIDTLRNALVRQDPGSGRLTEIGPLGGDPVGDAGFDVSTESTANGEAGTDTAYAVLRGADGTGPDLYRIDLTTGAATAIGDVGGDDPVVDIAVRPPVPLLAVLQSGPQGTGQQSITQVAADRPDVVVAASPITGLQPDESLVGIDRRPDGGALYGVSGQSRLYTVDPDTGAAAAVGADPFSPAASGAGFGVDFDPVADRLRLVSDNAQNLRLNPLDGAVAGIDGQLAYATGDPRAGRDPHVTAAAYAPATLFDLDTAAGALVTQDPDSGSLRTVGSLGVRATDSNGFDIAARFNQGFAALRTAGAGSVLYAVNAAGAAAGLPADGSAVAIGALALPPGTVAQGLAIVRDDVSGTVPDKPEPEAEPKPRPGRVKPAGLTGRVSPGRDRKDPFRFTVRGRVKLPPGVSKRDGCRGKTTIYTKRGGRTIAARRMFIKPNCHYKKRQGFSRRLLRRRSGTLKFRIRFQGNHELKPERITLQARFGR